MVIIWTVTDTIASPQKLTKARLSPAGGKRERAREREREREREVIYYQSAIGNCPLTLGARLSLARWVLPHSVSPPGGEKTGGGRERETRKAARADSA